MITVEINDRKVMARLRAMPEKTKSALLKKVTQLRLQLEAKIKQKLSGEVLNVRTGNLRRSIHSKTIDEATRVEGSAFSSGDVKYARIHEYGGTINHPGGTAYIVTASGAVFISNAAAATLGRNLPRTKPHTITMPERSFMRSSLADMKGEILAGLSAAVKEEVAK